MGEEDSALGVGVEVELDTITEGGVLGHEEVGAVLEGTEGLTATLEDTLGRGFLVLLAQSVYLRQVGLQALEALMEIARGVVGVGMIPKRIVDDDFCRRVAVEDIINYLLYVCAIVGRGYGGTGAAVDGAVVGAEHHGEDEGAVLLRKLIGGCGS